MFVAAKYECKCAGVVLEKWFRGSWTCCSFSMNFEASLAIRRGWEA
jgi:hypothetical protein